MSLTLSDPRQMVCCWTSNDIMIAFCAMKYLNNTSVCIFSAGSGHSTARAKILLNYPEGHIFCLRQILPIESN